MQRKEIFFFFFLWTWRETRAKRAEGGRTQNNTSRTWARGVPWAPCAPALIEGRYPIVGRPRWSAGHVGGPNRVLLFQWWSMTAIWFKGEWMGAGVGWCRPRNGPKCTWTWKSSKFMHALHSKGIRIWQMIMWVRALLNIFVFLASHTLGDYNLIDCLSVLNMWYF